VLKPAVSAWSFASETPLRYKLTGFVSTRPDENAGAFSFYGVSSREALNNSIENYSVLL
jgi:hypothetical protein